VIELLNRQLGTSSDAMNFLKALMGNEEEVAHGFMQVAMKAVT
jgi:hypothetical protein